ncbi:hypothetical protein A0H81_09493 [Grifola frondosa]|uniref:Uncharacterized protein n=1 Tax=Grifola frondosa TaxID=5627 RepID=A0A1C7M3A9_GRIFR|nr:hypothetical protein A0H81_09493 [Grifola frondosa]
MQLSIVEKAHFLKQMLAEGDTLVDLAVALGDDSLLNDMIVAFASGTLWMGQLTSKYDTDDSRRSAEPTEDLDPRIVEVEEMDSASGDDDVRYSDWYSSSSFGTFEASIISEDSDETSQKIVDMPQLVGTSHADHVRAQQSGDSTANNFLQKADSNLRSCSVIATEDTPRWVRDLWLDLVGKWAEFERLRSPRGVRENFPNKNRPVAIDVWMRSRRWNDKTPFIEDLTQFGMSWWYWWVTSNPDWRKPPPRSTDMLPAKAQMLTDWMPINKCGSSGMYVAIRSLSDVTSVLCDIIYHLVENSETSGKGKKRASSTGVHTPPRKRRRSPF